MKKIFKILIMTLYFSDLYSANSTIDVYGIDDPIASKIISHCNSNIQKYIEMESQMGAVSPDKLDDMISKHMKLHHRVIKQIKEYGNFNLVDVSIIYYPDKNKRYTTIDIVPSSKMFRIPKPLKREINKKLILNTETKNLFKLWSQYNENNINLLNKGSFSSKKRTCPVVHCVWGFDKKELIEYLPKIRNFANKNKKQLTDIIRLSSNNEERGNAIFILAHSVDYKSTASFLLNYIDDESDLVRNNSMRVLGAILAKYDIGSLDIHNILLALNYPYVTDRNKAAYVLWNIVRKDKSTHPLVIQKSGATLINLLKLKQPNNHDLAYLILKEISHQNYSDQDYQHWQQWIDLEKNKLRKS